MQLCYRTKTLQEVCKDFYQAKCTYGVQLATKIHQRIQELEAADSLHTLLESGIGRCHPLKGNKQGLYAMDLVHPFRLIIQPQNSELSIVQIMSIEDYH